MHRGVSTITYSTLFSRGLRVFEMFGIYPFVEIASLGIKECKSIGYLWNGTNNWPCEGYHYNMLFEVVVGTPCEYVKFVCVFVSI